MLDYRVLRTRDGRRGDAAGDGYCLVAVRLRTGRKHQIRVQFASRGHRIWGDAKYGERRNRLAGRGVTGIALHAMSLRIEHPVGRQAMTFRCRPPSSWGEFLPTPAEWDAALAPWDAVPQVNDDRL